MIDKLIKEAEENNLNIKEVDSLPDKFNGIIINNDILIRKNLSSPEKTVTLAEEIEHYNTNIGNIIDIRDTNIKKQELLARWSTYEKLLPYEMIIEAVEFGVSNTFEFADFLELPEDFVLEGLSYYSQRYGAVDYKEYHIQFGSRLQIFKAGKSKDKFRVDWVDQFGNIMIATSKRLIFKSALGVDIINRNEILKVKVQGLSFIVYGLDNTIMKIINIPEKQFNNAIKVAKEFKEFKCSTFETYIAGITKTNDEGNSIQHLVKKYLGHDPSRSLDNLILVQEPDNPHDRFAIKIVHDDIGHIGYIPAKHAVKINKIINNKNIYGIKGEIDKVKKGEEITYYSKLNIKYR